MILTGRGNPASGGGAVCISPFYTGVIPKGRAFTSGPRDLLARNYISPGDPSLRLKDGYARDDAIRGNQHFKLHHYPASLSVASPTNSGYDGSMAKVKKFDLEADAPIVDEEDQETLAAIDEGIRDADAGRVVPAEKVRELLPKWTTASSTRKKR